ncbi:uncharacterized protein LOC115634203 [Scaptodrosophila lebanonensis]|uniref:Uncharacterized protein LOC115634203 n=1 Tax=Drosophila lebanonensis TaxID=7225 RepID=A0A6J2UHN5_DROLE|nr:uncharacterized protein LOC115634203 [Scaptodrosophila lebanonensis]
MYAIKATLCLSILTLYLIPSTMGQGATTSIALPDFPKLASCFAPLVDMVKPLAEKIVPFSKDFLKCVGAKSDPNPGSKLNLYVKNAYVILKKALIEKFSCIGDAIKSFYGVMKPSLEKAEANNCWQHI